MTWVGTGAEVDVGVEVGVAVALDEGSVAVAEEMPDEELDAVLVVTDVAAVDETVMDVAEDEGTTRVSIAIAISGQ
jgi:hypothetical protein